MSIQTVFAGGRIIKDYNKGHGYSNRPDINRYELFDRLLWGYDPENLHIS